MPGPIDDTLKHLTELSPQDWVERGGWPAAPARLIDADIATLTGATDKVIRVVGAPDWLLAVDFQAGHDTVAKLPDLLLYNSALFKRHDLRVRSLLVLLYPGADSPQLTGFYERGFPGEPFDAALRYRVVRVWRFPPAQWLAGGLGLVPLAPLGDVRPRDLPALITQMKRRLEREAPPSQVAELWSATYILMGLRYERALIHKLLQGVVSMKESVTYQAILSEGEAKGEAKGKAEGETNEARKILLLQGRSRFGEPSAEMIAALNGLTDVHQLEALTVSLLQASSWQELLGLGSAGHRGRSRRKRS
jgi:predicted transposase YdaD